jgi:hypothetical protein
MMSIMFFVSNDFILCLRHLEYASAYIGIASSNMNIQFNIFPNQLVAFKVEHMVSNLGTYFGI